MATVEELLTPIPGPNPSGENVRYVPAFDKLKEARRAGGDWLAEAGTVDYGLVIKQCEELLLKRSKDLQIAVWLTEAWIIKNGFTGFQNGLLLTKGLIENFWDTLYPELEDGDTGLRLAPLDWLGGYLDLTLKRVPISKGGHSLIQYKESQMVGMGPDENKRYEDPEWDQKKRAYDTAVADGRVTGDVFDAGFQKTPKDYYVQLNATLGGILELLDALNVLGEEKFPEESPSFSKIRVALEEIHITANSLLEQKRKLEPDPVAEDEAVEEGAEEAQAEETQADAGTAEETVTVARVKKKKTVTGIEPESHEEAAQRLSAVATWLRTQDPQNPSSYLMLRGYRWGELRASGSTAPDQMLLEPPITDVRTGIKKLSLEGNWQELIRVGEEAMATTAGRGWLDLQRYMVAACENMYYYAAATAIKSALKSLLMDMPDMLNMTLMDDTPVANAETTNWIKDNILPPPVPEQPPPEQYMPPVEPDPEPEPEPTPSYAYANEDQNPVEERPPDAFDLAQDALRSGNKEQAIEILVREMSQERSGRAKFHRKMQLAQICLTIGRQVVARPILEELAGEIEKRRLDEWEPTEMVAHTLALLYRCMEDNDRKQQIYGWICRLDPVQAIACLK